MPKSLFQEIIFTIIMVFFMVYALICYNMTLAIGEFSNAVMLGAFKELIIMGPIAFILDMIVAGPLAKHFTFKIFKAEETKPIFIILSILQKEVFSIWIKTTIMNFPMAFFWQLCFAGPLVRKLFGLIFRSK